MSLIKKADVPAHFAARRALRRAGIQFSRRSVATGAAEAKTTGIEPTDSSSVGDISGDHSSPSAPFPPAK